MNTSDFTQTVNMPEIIEETLTHIAQHDTTSRAIGIYRTRVNALTPEEKIKLGDIITQLLEGRRAIKGTKCFNDSWAILQGEMEMPEIRTIEEASQ